MEPGAVRRPPRGRPVREVVDPMTIERTRVWRPGLQVISLALGVLVVAGACSLDHDRSPRMANLRQALTASLHQQGLLLRERERIAAAEQAVREADNLRARVEEMSRRRAEAEAAVAEARRSLLEQLRLQTASDSGDTPRPTSLPSDEVR